MRKHSRRVGCSIGILVVVAIGVIVLWQIVEPGWRAYRVHASIRPGMTLDQVEDLLTGRYFCTCEIRDNRGWQKVSRDEFAGVLERIDGNESFDMRLHIIFQGIPPFYFVFTVGFDCGGRVSAVTRPFLLD